MAPLQPATVEGFRAVVRNHAADDVFEQLAAAILRGELAPGSALPPERVLAERFGISRVIARQAVHRLAEVGLVRVRQGGTTVVLDPAAASDLRVIELLLRSGPSSEGDVRDLIERQLLQCHGIVVLASRRASRTELAALRTQMNALLAKLRSDDDWFAFEERLWRALAAATHNRIYILEMNWWYRLVSELPQLHPRLRVPLEFRIESTRALLDRLAEGDDAAGFYLALRKNVLDALARGTSSVLPAAGRRRKR